MTDKVTLVALTTTAVISAAGAQLEFLEPCVTPGQFQIAVAFVLLTTVIAGAWLNYQRSAGMENDRSMTEIRDC